MGNHNLLTILLLSSLLLGQSYDPLTGEQQNDPCIQAAIDAQNDVNGTLWYGAGCLFGIIGIGASYVIEPNPNAFKLAGKTSDYASVYTGCYRLEAKKVQQQNLIDHKLQKLHFLTWKKKLHSTIRRQRSI